jgi:DNA uptake protein ComE-like DNA-binding protein
MKILRSVVLPLIVLTAMCYAQSQQAAPPPTNQSSYPAETHKMNSAEKSGTPSENGQPVDLKIASKKDLAALPGIGPDYAQTIIDGRPYSSKQDLLKKSSGSV